MIRQQRHGGVLRLMPPLLWLAFAGCLSSGPPRYTSTSTEVQPTYFLLANSRLLPDASSENPSGREAAGELAFEKDRYGRKHAVYVLKAGEALYSAVVVRYCGLVDADEVNAMAEKLMAYNGIRNSSFIPTGARIKIPLEYLDEDILRGNMLPRRPIAARPVRSGKLHVILDAGHGGNDPGTTLRGWSEDEVAYDLMVRLKRLLERKGMMVYPLVNDNDTGDEPQRLPRQGHNEYVNVTPPYKMEESRTAVNMRVYLVDDIYRRLRRRGVRDDDIILISIHLDHLHPSVNGVMVYYPDAAERPEMYTATGRIYAGYQESRLSTISYDVRDNEHVESYSHDFAKKLIASCRNLRIPVHEYQPIRRFVFRSGKKWTPGIVHYSRVRTSVLIEAANLANDGDFNRIRSSIFRQRIAEAIARAIR